MAEAINAGGVYFTVDAKTDALLAAEKKVNESIKRIGDGLNQAGSAATKSAPKMKQLSKEIQGLGRESANLMTPLKGLLGLFGGIGLVQLGRDIIATADAWTQLQNRLRLVTDGTKELAQATEAVFNISQSTSQEIDTVAQVYQRFAQNAGRLGLSLNDVAEVTDVVAKAVAVSGASAEAASAALTQFGQGLASGTLRGEELNSVMEQTPALAQAIATGLGVSIGQLRQLGQDGKLTSSELIKALKAAGDSVNEQFDTRVKTSAQAWTELRNSVMRFVGELSGATNMSSSLADSITKISQAIDNADMDVLAQELEGIKGIISLVMDGIDELASVFKKYFPEMASAANQSFTQMALTTAKEVDSVVSTFRGSAGAISAVWSALAHNIPTFFTNAWNIVKKDAADLVNSLADMLNKPLQAVGFEGFSKVSFGAEEVKSLIDLTDALRTGWEDAAVGAGAYERTLKRVTDNAINSSVAQWTEEYGESVKKAVVATQELDTATKGKKKALTEAERAAIQNQQAIDKMAQSLYLAGLYGEELAIAQAKLSLNKYATPEQIQQVEALAKALYEAEELSKRASALGTNPEEIRKNIMGDSGSLSGGAYDEQQSKFDEDLQKEDERFWERLTRLQTALDAERLTQEEHNSIMEQMAEEHSSRVARIEQAKQANMYKTASTGLGAVADVLKQSQGEQSGIYKAMFAASKAFAIAESIVKIQQGIASAAALPFPANLPAMASVAAATAGIVSSIQSVSFGGGRQYGGPVDGSKMYRVNETGQPEVFNAGGGKQYFLPNTRGQVVPSDKVGMGSAPIVNVNISRLRADQGANISQGVDDEGRTVIDVVLEDLQTNGEISQGMQNLYGLKYRGQ